MKIAYSLDEIDKDLSPIALTIGNFDGIHLGHRAVLEHLKQTAKKNKIKSAVLTFSNHPSLILRPTHPTPLLCTIEHKIQLLHDIGIDLIILLPFTKEFSEQSAEVFLHHVLETLPFDILILGSDAHIGKNREGDRSMITKLADTLGFHVEYFPDYTQDGQRISSSLIRDYIQKGQLRQAEKLLGRPYSIYGPILKGDGRGAPLGFPTANLSVSNLCLPPLGVYAVSLSYEKKTLAGVANLGFAPTVRQENDPILEVHLFDQHLNLYGKTVDVKFFDFIRQERRFENLEELRKQIAIDIKNVKAIFQTQVASKL